jgi:hypothetical protein
MNTPRLILVRENTESFEAFCNPCVIVNTWDPGGRGRTMGEADMVCGTLPPGVDEVWAECGHGHAHLVVRQRSERAAQLGL